MQTAIRRVFIGVSVRFYEHDERYKDLEWAHSDADHMRDLFVESLGFEHDLPELMRAGEQQDIVRLLESWFSQRRWQSLSERNPPPDSEPEQREELLVLYWAGHGKLVKHNGGSGQQHFLIAYDTNAPDQGIPTTKIGELIAKSRIRESLLLIDTCHSGAGANDIASIVSTLTSDLLEEQKSGLVIMSAARPYELAYDKSFAPAFVSTVRGDKKCGDHSDEFIKLDALHDILNEKLSPVGQRVESNVTRLSSEIRLVPNPRWGRGPVVQAKDLEDHFDPQARGVRNPKNEGWFFTGRDNVLIELAAFLDPDTKRDPPCLRVLTGEAGSGKSAILSRLVILSMTDKRKLAETARALDKGDPKTLPKLHSVSAAVHARNKTTQQLIESLNSLLGLRIDGRQDARALIARMETLAASRRDAVTIVVDALDQMHSGEMFTTATLLGELAKLKNVRVLVAVRGRAAPNDYTAPSLVAGLGARKDDIIDLSEPRWVGDVAAYVQGRLRESRRFARRDQPSLVAEMAATVARAVGQQYHVAAVFIDNILANPARNLDYWRKHVPTSIGEAISEDLKRFGDDESDVRHQLMALAFAQGDGFPFELWMGVTERLFSVNLQESQLASLQDYVSAIRNSADDPPHYRLYLRAVEEYFQEKAAHNDDLQEEAARSLPKPKTSINAEVSKIWINAEVTNLALAGLGDLNEDHTWATADRYYRGPIAIHAAKSDQLARLAENPYFLLYADPSIVMPLLQPLTSASHQGGSRLCRAYGRVAPILSTMGIDERAAYLELACALEDSDAARVFAAMSKPWQLRWLLGNRRIPWHHTISVPGSGCSVTTSRLDGRPVGLTAGPVLRVLDLQTQQTLLVKPLPDFTFLRQQLGLLAGSGRRVAFVSIHQGRKRQPSSPLSAPDLFAQAIDEDIVWQFEEIKRGISAIDLESPGIGGDKLPFDLLFPSMSRAQAWKTIDGHLLIAALLPDDTQEGDRRRSGVLLYDSANQQSSFAGYDTSVVAVATTNISGQFAVIEVQSSGHVRIALDSFEGLGAQWMREGPSGIITSADVATMDSAILAAVGAGNELIVWAVDINDNTISERRETCPYSIDAIALLSHKDRGLVAVAAGGQVLSWEMDHKLQDFVSFVSVSSRENDINDVAWFSDEVFGPTLVGASSLAVKGRSQYGRAPARPKNLHVTGALCLWELAELRHATSRATAENTAQDAFVALAPNSVQFAGREYIVVATASGCICMVDVLTTQTQLITQIPAGASVQAIDAVEVDTELVVGITDTAERLAMLRISTNGAFDVLVDEPSDGRIRELALLWTGSELWTLTLTGGTSLKFWRGRPLTDRWDFGPVPLPNELDPATLLDGLGLHKFGSIGGVPQMSEGAYLKANIATIRRGLLYGAPGFAVAGTGGVLLFGPQGSGKILVDQFVRAAVPLGQEVLVCRSNDVSRIVLDLDKEGKLSQPIPLLRERARWISARQTSKGVAFAVGLDGGSVFLTGRDGQLKRLEFPVNVTQACVLQQGGMVFHTSQGLVALVA